jgi:hypothetical protein
MNSSYYQMHFTEFQILGYSNWSLKFDYLHHQPDGDQTYDVLHSSSILIFYDQLKYYFVFFMLSTVLSLMCQKPPVFGRKIKVVNCYS